MADQTRRQQSERSHSARIAAHSQTGTLARLSALWDVDLSAGDLKLQLYDQLKSSGVLHALKSRLRTQVLSRLQDESQVEFPSPNPRTSSLWTRAFESLLLKYFEVYSYGYSASVFRAEAGLGSSCALSRSDVEEILRLKHHEGLHKAVERSGEPSLAIGLLKAIAVISEAQGHEGSSSAGHLQSGQARPAGGMAESVSKTHASQLQILKAMELEALQRLQQQQQKIEAEQRQESLRLQTWQADLLKQSSDLQVLRKQLEEWSAGVPGQSTSAIQQLAESNQAKLRGRYKEALQQERAQRDVAVRQAASLSAELQTLRLHHQQMTTDPQLIKAVKSTKAEQPAKKDQWQTLARQLETRLAMWQRHATSAEAVAQRARAQQDITAQELEDMHLSLSAVRQERDELRLLLSRSSSRYHKHPISPGKLVEPCPAAYGGPLKPVATNPFVSPSRPLHSISPHLPAARSGHQKTQQQLAFAEGFRAAASGTDDWAGRHEGVGCTSVGTLRESDFARAGPGEALHRLRQHAAARHNRRGQGQPPWPAQSDSLEQALSKLGTSFSGSSTCDSHGTSAISLSDGHPLSALTADHRNMSASQQQPVPQNMLLDSVDISSPSVPSEQTAVQLGQCETSPAGPLLQMGHVAGDERPSASQWLSSSVVDSEPCMASRTQELSSADADAPSAQPGAESILSSAGIPANSSASQDYVTASALPQAPQPQQLLLSESPKVLMRPAALPQPPSASMNGLQPPPGRAGHPSTQSPTVQASSEQDLCHVQEHVAVLETRIAAAEGQIPSPSKTGVREQSPGCQYQGSPASSATKPRQQQILGSRCLSLLPQAEDLVGKTNLSRLSQQGAFGEEDLPLEIHGLPYSRLSEEEHQPLYDEQPSGTKGAAKIQSIDSREMVTAELGTLGQNVMSDQPIYGEHDDLLLSYEQEHNQSGASSSAV
ncbi:hypothetical protein WJX74_005411 [Apatococcus lobatus]|uniref:LisH domain-containing protein n=1 Tax=Apatococcus lobatus TaxID=904363 RepID=A0AAW1RDJ8_9CHLO